MEAGSTPAQPFTIGKQTHALQYDNQGNQYNEWTIPFTTPSGVDSFVIVSDADHTPEKVAQLITERVRNIEAIAALGKSAASDTAAEAQ